MTAARRYGTVISYDLNYRPSLWKANGGPARAQEVNRALAPLVDVMLGNEEDFTACLGLEVPGTDPALSILRADAFAAMIAKAVSRFPQLPRRGDEPACRQDRDPQRLGCHRLVPGNGDHGRHPARRPGDPRPSRRRRQLRFRAGPRFPSAGTGCAEALEYGAAHGALAMTTPGDTTMATVSEVERLMAGSGARVQR